MKRLLSAIVGIMLGGLLALSAIAAPNYAFTNPTYVPTASAPLINFTAPGTYIYQAQNISVLTMRVTGTCTSLVGTVQGTNDGTNWTNLVGSVVGPTAASVVNIGTTGFWQFAVAGLNQVRFNITALTATCNVQMAGTSAGLVMEDPCNDPGIMESSAAINQGASATTKVIDTVAGTTIYVCGFVATATGTTPTFTFKTGTHVSSDCDTNPASLSGAMVPSATTGVVEYSTGGVIFQSILGGQICLTTAATTSVQGIISYVQQ